MDEILSPLRQAEALLRAAERSWPDAIADLPDSRDARALEELLHVATHETQSQLALSLQEIERLLARLAVRRRFDLFPDDAFDRIVAQGWSTTLVGELHAAYSSLTLAELSAVVKELCAAWSAVGG